MSVISMEETISTTPFSNIFLSYFFLFCSLILSHPLYFSYLIFFSPYLLKILSFLSPLFITTSLLLLALFISTTSSPTMVIDYNNSVNVHELVHGQPKLTLLNGYQRLKVGLMGIGNSIDENDYSWCFEELEVYKIVFETSTFGFRENPDEVLKIESKEVCSPVESAEEFVDKFCACVDGLDISASFDRVSRTKDIEETKIAKLGEVLQEKKECAKEVEPLVAGFEKGDDEEQKEEDLSMRKESKAIEKSKVKETTLSMDFDKKTNMENYERSGSNLGSFGSMRMEKEWRRTLACKLFEERHNAEGMDSLWETYESDTIKTLSKSRTKKQSKSCIKMEYNGVRVYDDEDDDDDDVEDDDEIETGDVCCLQALKFSSSGKMNLGMRKPNLVKFSKALKGFRWFHQVNKHGKKV